MKKGKRVLVALVSTVVFAIVAIEVLSRVADGSPDDSTLHKLSFEYLDPAGARIKEVRAIPHPYLAYALKPGWRSAPSDPQRVSHNSLGFRGKETTWKKPPGVFRIVTLGGSSVYGSSESNDDAVWSQRLEVMLNERYPERKIEVVNCGCYGYTSFEMLIQLALRAVNLDPDVVIVYETVNDMRAALYTAGAMTPAIDNTHWRAVWPVDRPSSLEKQLQKSRTYVFLRRYMTNYVSSRADLGYWTMVNFKSGSDELYCGNGQGGYPNGVVPREGLDNYRRNLEEMISIAESRGARVFIATQALMEWDLKAKECPETQLQVFREIQDIQREVAQAHGVALGETGAAIEAEDAQHFAATGKHLFLNDVHPTDAGSDLIARTVAAALEQAGVVAD
ncbi:MAG: SGNH/GDSL hydrolase family protein [Planctomycetota bacterium]